MPLVRDEAIRSTQLQILCAAGVHGVTNRALESCEVPADQVALFARPVHCQAMKQMAAAFSWRPCFVKASAVAACTSASSPPQQGALTV